MVKVEIDNDIRWLGINAKDKFPGFKDFGCAKFLEPIILYRGMLRQELIYILSHPSKEIEGGDFSVPLERYFGASYAYNINDAAKAAQAIHEPYFTNKGINQNQSKYIIGIQAKDEIFGHLSLNKYIPFVDGKYYPNGPFEIDPKIGYLGLGFSVLVKPDKIVKIYKVKDKKIIDVTNKYKKYIGKNESELEQLVEIHNTSKKEDIDRAISEIRSLGIQNPFFYRETLLYNNVGIEITNWDGTLHISAIRTLKKGTGDATKAMKQICQIADKNNVVIGLTAKPFGYEDNRLNTNQLKDWYKRLGFKLLKYNEMERLPKKLTENKIKLRNILFENNDNQLKISDSSGAVSVFYKGDYIIPAACDISNYGGGLWFVNRVHVPDKLGKSKGIGTIILSKAIEIIIKKYKPKYIIVTPGGYDGEADSNKRIHFYEKNGFIKYNGNADIMYYDKLSKPSKELLGI